MSLFLDRASFQPKAINHLKRIVNSNRIPHALLFSGPEGVGKHFISLQFIKELNHIKGNEARFKSKINELEEPYLKFVCALPRGAGESSDDKPTAKLTGVQLESVLSALSAKRKNPFAQVNIEKANNIKISSIRDIRRYLSLNYEENITRVIILHEAHKMSIDSQNAILKSLEEPPENTMFILHTNDHQKLLPTIRSRCQQIWFNPITSDNVAKIINEYYQFDEKLVKIASQFSQGSVTAAVNLLENNFDEYLDKCINILRFALGRRFNTSLKYFDEIVKDQGPNGFYICIDLICKWFLDVLRNREGLEVTYFTNHLETIVKFNNKYSDKSLERVLNKLISLSANKESNFNLNISMSNVIFEIGHIGIG